MNKKKIVIYLVLCMIPVAVYFAFESGALLGDSSKKKKPKGIVFNDKQLSNYLKETFRSHVNDPVMYHVPFKAKEVNDMKSLDISDLNVQTLEGLEHLLNLQELIMPGNKVSDLSPLENLPNLKYLNISRNPISDISVLATLPALQSLEGSTCKITSLAPLSGLINLKTVILDHNQITDVQPVSELPQLSTLNLEFNKVYKVDYLTSLSCIELLNLGYNKIVDPTCLLSLKTCRFLYLNNNEIKDLAPFAKALLKDWDVDKENLSISLSGNPFNAKQKKIVEALKKRGFKIQYY